MADRQRQYDREERKLKKEKKRKIILWSVFGVLTLILVIMRVSEININSVIDRFTDENGKFSLTDGVTDDNFPYSIDSSKNVILTNVNNRLGVLTPSSFTVINASDGNAEYVFDHGYSNPVIDKSGVYTIVYDQGAKSFRLDTTSSAVYQKTTENQILCATVNKKGIAAIAENISAKHCSINVYNTSLETIFSKNISDGYIVDMALSANGKKLAVIKLGSVDASLDITAYVYKITTGELLGTVKLPQGSLVDIRYNGDSLYTIGDSYVGVVKNDSEYEEVLKAGTVSNVCFDYSPSGELVIVHSEFDNSNSNVCSVISSSGKIKTDVNISGSVRDISASSSRITVLTTNEILSFSYRGQEKGSADSNDTVKSICTIGNRVLRHRQTIIEKSEVSLDN
ncbi:MAG: hypothetical protein J1E81_09655 [Eubacterium sp.]|nr:hypothetical protein [Eubacterium sp.]